jgi:hypothetical protein
MNLPTATVPVLALRKLQFLAGPFMSIISSGCRALKWMNADVFFRSRRLVSCRADLIGTWSYSDLQGLEFDCARSLALAQL